MTQGADELRRIELYTSPNVPPSDLPVPRNIAHPGTSSDPESLYKKQYAFTSDWFTGSLPVWRKVLAEYRGKPNLRYLEIGVFEGRSLFWMLENVLTDPTCRATGIDFFFINDAKTRFYANLELSGQPQKVTMLEGLSDEILLQLQQKNDPYDLIYVDGSHAAEDVLFDLIMSWRLLKVGGLLLLDDYGMTPDRSAENCPMVAIDAFITAHRNSIEIVHHGYSVVMRKRQSPPCDYKRRCTRVADHIYDWDRRTLVELDTGKRVDLTSEEVAMVEQLLRSRRFGATSDQFYAEDLATIRNEPGFERIVQLLSVTFRN